MKSFYLSLMCVFLFNASYGQKTNYGNNPKAAHYYSTRGINIYTEQYGKGEPLILIHGNGGSIASMASIIPYFSKRYHVIAIDGRAHGKTIDTNDSLSFRMMADDVSALLDTMKISAAYIIGWSDGGIVAIEMAIRHPNKIIKLASTGANVTPDSTAFISGMWADSKKYYDANKNIPKRSEKEKRNWKYFMLDWLYPTITPDELHKIKTPCLIISGDKDIIRLEHTLLIYRNIPNAQLWVMPHSGHGTLIEHPKEFCKGVNSFFNENNESK